MSSKPKPDVWIAASKALGREVTTEEPYPHICGRTVPGSRTVSGRPVTLDRRNCAACAEGRRR